MSDVGVQAAKISRGISVLSPRDLRETLFWSVESEGGSLLLLPFHGPLSRTWTCNSTAYMSVGKLSQLSENLQIHRSAILRYDTWQVGH